MAASLPDIIPIVAVVPEDASIAADLDAEGGSPAHRVNWTSLAALGNLALLAWSERRFADAVDFYRQIIAANLVFEPMYMRCVPRDPTFVGVLYAAGRPRAALALARRLVSMSESIENLDLRAGILGSVAQEALEDGDPGAARQQLGAVRSLGPANIHAGHWLSSMLMRAAALDGDATAMEAHHLELSRAIEAEDPGTCRGCDPLDYGRSLEALGRTREAIEAYEHQRSKVVGCALPADAARCADASLALGKVHRKRGDDEVAERELVRALAEYRALYPIMGPYHARTLQELGELALTRRRWDEARVYLREAASSFAVTAEPDYPALARTRLALARALTTGTR